MTDFAGKTAVITGAGRGLGFGMARRFGQGGAHVVIADIDAQTGARAADKLCGENLSASYEPLDVRDPASSVTLVDKVARERGPIHIWVNNAGVAPLGPAETLPIEAWNQSIAVMLSGTFYCSQAVGRHMLACGSGVIVNVASVSAYTALEKRVAYDAAKAGIAMLTQTLGVEWAKRGVRVVGIAPGVIRTELLQDIIDSGLASVESYERRIPQRRLGSVEEIAEAVAYLASDQASYIVAETMKVDGGWTAYQLF